MHIEKMCIDLLGFLYMSLDDRRARTFPASTLRGHVRAVAAITYKVLICLYHFWKFQVWNFHIWNFQKWYSPSASHVALFSAPGAFDDDVIAARDAGRVLCFTAADLT
jgi:hypothetical protein